MYRYRDLLRNLNKQEQTLDNLLLFVDFFPNRYDMPVILNKDGAVMLLFELAGLDYEGLSENEKEQFSYYMRSALEQFPDDGKGFLLSNMMIRERSNLVALKEGTEAPEIVQYVQDKKQGFWQEVAKNSYQNKVICAVRFFTPGKVEPSLRVLMNEKKTLEFSRGVIKDRVEKLVQAVMTMESGMSRFGFRLLDRDEAYKVLYQMVNQAPAGPYRRDLSLNAQLPQTNWRFLQKEKAVQIGDEFLSVVGIKFPPSPVIALHLRRLYELSFPFVLKQSVGFADKVKIFKEQEFNKNISMALSSASKTCGLYVDEVKEYQTRIESEKELPIWWTLAVYVKGPDIETLRDRVLKVQTVLKEIGSVGVVEDGNLKNSFFAMLPGHERLNLRKSLLATADVGDLLSAYTLYMGDYDPVDYFGDRLNGVFSYNPFTDRENAHHMAITGPTGSGKSFAVNKMLISSLVENPEIYVIDLSQSFTEFFELLREEIPEKTAIMEISQTETDFQFNPFLLKDLEEPVPEHQLNFCLGLLKLMIGKERMGPEREYVLLEALKQFFREYGMLLKSSPTPPPPLDLLGDIIETESKDKGMAAALKLWCQGRKGKIFNSGQDTLKSAQFVYFDLRNLENEEDLLAVLVYAIFAKIYGDVTQEGKRNVKKFLFLDEAHRYLRHEEFAYWIELLFRTGRHYRLLMGVITQSINDLIDVNAKWSKGIMENLKQAFFFGGQKNISAAFRSFQLTEYHEEMYRKMRPEKREVFYWSASGLRRVLQPKTDPYTYWLATTDPAERQVRGLVRKICKGDIKKTIETCVAKTKFATSPKERVAKLTAWIERHREDVLEDLNLMEIKG